MSKAIQDERSEGALDRFSRHVFWTVLGIVLLGIVLWFAWLYRQISYTAGIDNAQPADAIAVFGAAEYAGRPSPVLHARLDKALLLYQRGLAPLIITLGGGSAKDEGNTEGAAGRDYLLANGVPLERIIAETSSVDTEQQVDRLADIADEHNLHTMDVVSDGTHLFRIALLCRRAGLAVYTSPRAALGHIDDLDKLQRVGHEMLSYTSVALDLHISALHRWVEGKND
ncbi:MAG: YdcF family protein [Janthinobacterium lividum]